MKVEDARASIDQVLLKHRGRGCDHEDDAHRLALREEILEAVMDHRKIGMIREGHVSVKEPRKATTMLQIYEAAGGVLSEDGTQVSLTPPLKPFDIELTVLPSETEWTNGEPEMITFSVLLDDEWTIIDGRLFTNTFGETVKMPVSQVKIIKED